MVEVGNEIVTSAAATCCSPRNSSSLEASKLRRMQKPPLVVWPCTDSSFHSKSPFSPAGRQLPCLYSVKRTIHESQHRNGQSADCLLPFHLKFKVKCLCVSAESHCCLSRASLLLLHIQKNLPCRSSSADFLSPNNPDGGSTSLGFELQDSDLRSFVESVK